MRGRIDRARAEIEAALGDALAAANASVLLQAWVVAARVALEEGDLVRVDEALDRADALPVEGRGKSEIWLLRAAAQRARGLDARERIEAAVAAALETRDRHLSAEAHALAARIHRDAGDEDMADEHLARARALVEQVAASLPADDSSPASSSEGWDLEAAPPTSTKGTSSHGQETMDGHPQPWTPPPLQPTPGPRPDQW